MDRFALFGLTIDSDLDLVAPRRGGAGPADVIIRRGTVAPPAGEVDVDGPRVRVSIAGVGRFAIRSGREVLVDAQPAAPPENVRLYLMGSILGVLLHQRGMLPLHANAVQVGSGAVAFLGESGAGKSTLAAWAHDRGHAVLCDDVCVVDFAGDGTPFAQPGVPRLRLGEETMVRSGRDPTAFPRAFTGDRNYDKRDVPPDRMASEAAPLTALYLLERGPAFDCVPLRGGTRVEALFAHTYRGHFVDRLGGAAAHWRQCLLLAERVPMFRFVRRWSTETFEEDARAIIDHAAGLPAPRSAASRK